MSDVDLELVLAILAEKHIAGAASATLASPPEGPLHGVLVPPRLAFAAWTVLREAVPRTGAWPVVIGSQPRLPSLERGAEPVAEILAKAARLDPQVWAKERVDAAPGGFAPPSAPWPTSVQRLAAFQILRELAQQPDPAVIALAPTALPHEVAAHLRFGGRNVCPPPEVHVAVLRTWHEHFGAQPVVMTGNTLELLVGRPVATRDEALALAGFQYVYCADVVNQGTRSVEALAALLLGDPRWFFWWD
jgi:hypothetical protein